MNGMLIAPVPNATKLSALRLRAKGPSQASPARRRKGLAGVGGWASRERGTSAALKGRNNASVDPAKSSKTALNLDAIRPCPQTLVHTQNVAAVPLSNKLPRKDSNLDKQIQNLLCYHYTTRQKIRGWTVKRRPGGVHSFLSMPMFRGEGA